MHAPFTYEAPFADEVPLTPAEVEAERRYWESFDAASNLAEWVEHQAAL